MRDLKFFYDKDSAEFDLGLENWELAYDDGLETSILISLFSDARVDPEELRAGETDRRGYWADKIDATSQENTGSKLWLLDRAKATDETLEQAKEYCLDALNWLLEDGIASEIEVTTSYPRRGVIEIAIQITRPTGDELNFKYDYVWASRSSSVR